MVQLVPLGSCSMVWGTNSIWSVIDASGIVLLIKSQHTNLGDAKESGRSAVLQATSLSYINLNGDRQLEFENIYQPQDNFEGT
jgi:hypothetical protein